MLFNAYLEALLGSKVKVKILRALLRFETKTFTLRELAGHIKVSHTAVLKSLGDLQGMNIIKIESHGTSNLITINKESCLYKELKGLFDFEVQTIQQLKEEIKKILPQAKSVALFGSIAMKREGLDSDIDVLVITQDKSKINEIIAKNQEAFSKQFGNVISAHIMTEGEFNRKRNTPLVKGILESHILIEGDEL
ncbi:nucleotidyltransferase domain-containing protein [Candidatus Woesearchaeota archaeon]|nr:nucleotidyltransferase domain-containing protein [Candidatus Woesearchaeota archaeon]